MCCHYYYTDDYMAQRSSWADLPAHHMLYFQEKPCLPECTAKYNCPLPLKVQRQDRERTRWGGNMRTVLMLPKLNTWSSITEECLKAWSAHPGSILLQVSTILHTDILQLRISTVNFENCCLFQIAFFCICGEGRCKGIKPSIWLRSAQPRTSLGEQHK